MYYIYIVQCKDGTLYTGWTTNIENRLNKHNQGKGAKYTQGRCPVVLKYWEEVASKEEALRREHALKKLTRREKLQLINKA